MRRVSPSSSEGSTSSRNGDGCWSASSTAVTSRDRRAREHATTNDRSSSARTASARQPRSRRRRPRRAPRGRPRGRPAPARPGASPAAAGPATFLPAPRRRRRGPTPPGCPGRVSTCTAARAGRVRRASPTGGPVPGASRRTRRVSSAACGRRTSRQRGTAPAPRRGHGRPARPPLPRERRAAPRLRLARPRPTAPTEPSARPHRRRPPPGVRPPARGPAARRVVLRPAGAPARRNPAPRPAGRRWCAPSPSASSWARSARRTRRSPTVSRPPSGEHASRAAVAGSSGRGADAHAHGIQQRTRGRLLAQRHVAAEHADRDRGPRQGAPQRGDLRAGPRDDGHLRPTPPRARRARCAARGRRTPPPARCSAARRRARPRRRAGRDRPAVLHGADRSDALRDPPDHRPQPGVVPPRRPQHDRARTELAGSRSPQACPPDQRRCRAAERLHGRVRVRQQQHPGTVVGEHPQQPGGGRGALLVVVDDDDPPARAHRTGHLVLPRQQRLRGLVDHDRRVQPRAQVRGAGAQLHDVEVLLVQPRRAGPDGPAVRLGEGGEVHRGQATLGRPHQQVAQLVAEGAQPEHVGPDLRRPREGHPLAGGVPGEQVAEEQVLLGARDQRRDRVTQQRRARPEHRERRRRRGLHERPARRPAQPRRHPVPQVRRRTTARREDQHVLRGQSPFDRGDDRLERDRGLAGPRGAEHEHRRIRRDDRRSLLGIELHQGTGTLVGDVRERRAHEAQGVRGAGHATIPSRATDTRTHDPRGRPDGYGNGQGLGVQGAAL